MCLCLVIKMHKNQISIENRLRKHQLSQRHTYYNLWHQEVDTHLHPQWFQLWLLLKCRHLFVVLLRSHQFHHIHQVSSANWDHDKIRRRTLLETKKKVSLQGSFNKNLIRINWQCKIFLQCHPTADPYIVIQPLIDMYNKFVDFYIVNVKTTLTICKN